jgi:small-conductance mechanosensitive channel
MKKAAFWSCYHFRQELIIRWLINFSIEMKEGSICFFALLGCALVGIHIYSWLTPNDIFYTAFPVFDKVEHLLAGMVLAGLYMSYLERYSAWEVIGIVLVLGVMWEVVETSLMFDAKADILLDLVFDILGAVITWLLSR